MAEIQDKLIDIKGLDAYDGSVNRRLQLKLNNPNGLLYPGRVLTINDDNEPEWKELPTNPTTDNIRQIVNEQLAKTKFTVNDQGHLIIETPEA